MPDMQLCSMMRCAHPAGMQALRALRALRAAADCTASTLHHRCGDGARPEAAQQRYVQTIGHGYAANYCVLLPMM
jgi:hypothetical protein